MKKPEINIPLSGGTVKGKAFVFVEDYIKVLQRQLIMFKDKPCEYVIKDQIESLKEFNSSMTK